MVFSITSCKPQLIDSPTRNEHESKSPADYPDIIYPPKVVTATNGTYRKIKISWAAVENAIDYALYSAETPFDTFTKIAETTGTEYEIEAEPGTTLYFAVGAINYYGTESAKSKVISGSSLATPIITEIEDDTTTSFLVNWWMDNCDVNTYENDVTFTVKVYDKDKRLLPDFSKSVAGNQRSAKIENLISSTKYWFTVEASVKIVNEDGTEYTNKAEESDYTEKESAHKITPEKVRNLCVTQGIDNQVKLSFEIPEPVWSKDGNIWELKPVYFSIMRKETESEDTFNIFEHQIATIGSIPESTFTSFTKNANYHFDCTTNKIIDSINKNEVDFIFIESPTQNETSPLQYYISNSKITFVDKSAIRGKKYDYIVRSFPDYSANATDRSDNTSVTETVTGWAISQPNLVVKETYNKNDENIISNVKVSFENSNFETYGIDYKYVISRILTDEETETVDKVFFTDNFKSFEDVIPATTTAKYYRYNLYILSKDAVESENIPDSYLDFYSSNKIVTVIDDFSKLPVLESFSVEDGYANKFVINCEAELGIEYTLTAIPVINMTEGAKKTSPVNFTNNKFELKSFDDSTSIQEGQAYKFILKAKLGEISKEVALDDLYYTLGTPTVTFNTYEYDSITVTWPKVQMASDTYEVTAEYTESTCDEDTGELITPENTKITFDESKNLYTCTITEPSGFNKSYISGRPINLKVKATSAKHQEETSTTDIVVRTLGPAEIETKQTEQPQKDQTKFSWSPAVGAKKYLVYRIMYGDKEKTDTNIIGTDRLIIDVEKLTVENDSDQDNNGRSIIEFDSNESIYKYTLIDKQVDATETYGYQFNQERIQWGYPIDYVVLPLRENDNANSISFNYANQTTTFNTTSLISYETDFIKEHKVERCTFGYGFNVHATKSESGSRIKITWEKPNNVNKSVSIYRMPFNKTANYNYGSIWERIATEDSNTYEYEDFIDQKKSHLAYVYAVQYDSTSDLVSSYRTSPYGLGMKEKNYDEKYTNANKTVEPSNKGYLFSITNVEAQPIDGTNSYKELISWNSTWDFEERALCPTSFDIQVKNKNLAYTKDWISIARVNISPKGEFSFDNNFTLPENNDYDVYVNTDSIGEVTVEPNSFINNQAPIETNGLLKVLRDTRHYYSFYITDGTSYDRQFDDETLYTYRNITDSELVKCINLILADALYQAHIDKTDGIVVSAEKLSTFCEGKEGTFTFTFTAWKKNSQWGFSGKDYIHVFRCGSPIDTKNYLTSDFTLCGENSSEAKGCDQQKLYHLPLLSLTVKHNSGLASYSKPVTIIVGESGTSENYTLKETVNGEEFDFYPTDDNKKSINRDYGVFMKWFPYWLGNNISGTPVTSYNESYPLYMTSKETDSDTDKSWKTWWN